LRDNRLLSENSVRLPEFENDLVGLVPNRRIEYGQQVRIRGIAQRLTLGLKHKAGSRYLRANGIRRAARMKALLESSFRCGCLRIEDCERAMLAPSNTRPAGTSRKPDR
jgi:hypothetical protein